MAKEKVVQPEMTDYEKMQLITEAKESAKDSIALLHVKLTKSWDKYLAFKNVNKYEEAARELRWYLFNQKLKNFTEKMLDFLERVEDLSKVLQIITVVNQGLSTITGFQQGVEIRTLKKNLKGMTNAIKKFDKTADVLTRALDDVFGNKPNIFVRFYRFVTKTQKTPADALRELEEQVDPSAAGGTPPDGPGNGGVGPDTNPPKGGEEIPDLG